MLAVTAVPVLAVGVVGLTRASAVQSCADYSSYSAIASAAGALATEAVPGELPVTEADMGLPESQATYDSLAGSTSRAGAPYSDVVAGNVGVAHVDANSVPVFALSQYPADPKEEKTQPGLTLKADTTGDSATANTDTGGAGSSQSSAGRVQTSAQARCGDAASVEADADNRVDVVDVAGVLRIGSVQSHAKSVVDSAGGQTLDGAVAVEDATVLGQRVAITDQGVVAGSSRTPLPVTDPVARALNDAGITVRYIAADKDVTTGEVIAPGLQVVITREVKGVGSGPSTTTLTLGRAYTRASLSGGATSAPGAEPSPSSPLAPSPSGPSTGLAPLPAPSVSALAQPPALSTQGGSILRLKPAGRVPPTATTVTAWSIARAYTAVGIGLLLVAISLLRSGRLGWPRAGSVDRRLGRARHER